MELDVENASLGLLVARYLVHSYLYYIRDRPIMEDKTFDAICRRLYREFDSVEHQHGYLLDRDALQAGTAYHLKSEDYPLIVRGIGEDILRGKTI